MRVPIQIHGSLCISLRSRFFFTHRAVVATSAQCFRIGTRIHFAQLREDCVSTFSVYCLPYSPLASLTPPPVHGGCDSNSLRYDINLRPFHQHQSIDQNVMKTSSITNVHLTRAPHVSCKASVRTGRHLADEVEHLPSALGVGFVLQPTAACVEQRLLAAARPALHPAARLHLQSEHATGGTTERPVSGGRQPDTADVGHLTGCERNVR